MLASASRPNPYFPHSSSHISLSDSTTTRHFMHVDHLPPENFLFLVRPMTASTYICKFICSYSKEAHVISMKCAPVLRRLSICIHGWSMDIIDLDHCHVDISTPYPCQQEIKGKPVALHHAGYGDIPSRDANSSLGFMLI